MVSVTTYFPSGAQVDAPVVEHWLTSISEGRSPSRLAALEDASRLVLGALKGGAGTVGESRLVDVFAVAEILANLGLDCDTLTASLIYGARAHLGPERSQWPRRFGEGVVRMVEDLERIGAAASVSSLSEESEQTHSEDLRRMLLSIAEDVRVVLIVLAERLHQMRVIKDLPETVRRPIARETLHLYSPLANRLGIWQVKWELEDLCLRYLEPEEYKRIAGALDGKRQERESYVAAVIDTLQSKCREAGLRADITGRPKHIYSIWRKMRRKSVDIDRIFDLLAVRVLVDSVADCYAVLGIVHGLWRYIPGEFDDYIATPKANMYRSLHTAVIGPEDKPLEVQIRTTEMHSHAELGVAAHWRYKENRGQDAELERRILWMRHWLELRDEADSENFVENFKAEFEPVQVYVFTPKGKVVELPRGSTAVDFAYAIHSDVGHRCRGARVDGRIVPLNQPLRSGQAVEILTVKEGGPSRDWLTPQLGYVSSAKARNRIRQWFKQQDYDEHMHLGRAALERELSRLAVPKQDLDRLAHRFNFQKSDDLYAAIGRGDVSPIQAANALQQPQPRKRPPKGPGPERRAGTIRGEVMVEGVEDLMTHMARCCKPVPYDAIVGYITRGRGVTVHRRDCAMIRKMDESDRSRLVRVLWSGTAGPAAYAVDIQILAGDRKGLLRDISSVLTNEDVDVLGVKSQSNRRTDTAGFRFTVEIADMEQLSRILDRIQQLPEVLEARRVV